MTNAALRTASTAALLAAGILACGGHHHWVRSGATHEGAHQELARCEATAGGSAITVEDCMEEKGFSPDHHHFTPETSPALGAIPRIPGR